MTLADALAQVEQRGPGYTVELLRYDPQERTVADFKHQEGLHLMDADATIEWFAGSHFHEGERLGQIVLQETLGPDGTAEHPHNVILIRYHEARS